MNYRNEIKFSTPQTITSHNLDSTIEDVKKMFLRYDYNKNQRPDKNQQVNFLKELLNNRGLKNNEKPLGTYHEKLPYDFFIYNHGIKMFVFKGKNLNKLTTTIKAWAFTADEMNQRNIKTTFIYDHEIESQDFEHVKQILKKNANLYRIDKSIEFIDSISPQMKINTL